MGHLSRVAIALGLALSCSACKSKSKDNQPAASSENRTSENRTAGTGAPTPGDHAALDAAAPPADAASAAPVPDGPPITSDEVTFEVAGRTIGGTFTHPAAPGRSPTILLMAGSGPTDRNWESPLLPGKNGSARLLAEALARRGIASLRFDKALTGSNHGPALAELSLDTYTDEAKAALALLRARPDVDADHIFVAGHSEGGIHVTRLALAEGAHVAGVIYLSAAGRSMRDIMLGQVEGNFRNGAGFSAEATAQQMAPLRQAFDDFAAGKPVDPKKVSMFPGVQQLAAAIFRPDTARLTRPLLTFDPAPEAAKLTVPVFVYNGAKDVQVDPELDAGRLAKFLRDAGRDVTLHISPDANHVLKHEPLAIADIRKDLASAQNGYNAADRVLDPDIVDALSTWILAHATHMP